MKSNNLKQRIKNNELVLGTFMKSNDPCMAEVLGTTGLDFFVLDNEHVSINQENISNIIRAAQLYNIAPIIRVTCNEQSKILQVLDAGAYGVQVPNIDTFEQAKYLQDCTRYYPLGKRGFSPNVRAAEYGDIALKEYIAMANEKTVVVAHCETVESAKNIDQILLVEGIDVIFIGPMDLSQSFGKVGDMKNPELINCIEEVTKKTIAAGKAVGTVCSLDNLKNYVSMGMKYMLIGNDQGTVKNYFTKIVNEIKSI